MDESYELKLLILFGMLLGLGRLMNVVQLETLFAAQLISTSLKDEPNSLVLTDLLTKICS